MCGRIVGFLKIRKSEMFYIGYVIVLFFLFHHIIGLAYISSGSMMPYLYTDDIMIFNRLAYIWDEPSRGDVITFNRGKEAYCKRIVAIEGDVVSFEKMRLHINGIEVEEQYLIKVFPTLSDKTFEVPEGKVFVLGDCRMYSYDSREWDNPYVDIEDINGKEVCIIPLHKIINYFTGEDEWEEKVKLYLSL